MKQRLDPYLDYLIPIGIGALCYLLFFHRLAGIGLVGPDEPRYAAVAREMYLSNDYITPRLHGQPWFEKPALFYWGAALSYAVFGIDEWAARFPSALGATISVFFIYWCGRRLFSRAVGFLAALILASSIGFFAFARAASMDMPLAACLTMALVFFLVGYHASEPGRRWWLYGFYASLGLGALAKGPVAFALAGLVLTVFTILRWKWNEWRSWHPEGVLVGLAIASPWYVACTWVNGFEFIDIFIINHNLQRFMATTHGHARPIYFYFPVLLLLTFPWTFLLVPAWRRRFAAAEQILVVWALVPFILFSLSGSKLPGYILHMVPPLALLCAIELVRPSARAFRIVVFLEAAVMVFIGVAFGFFGAMLNLNPHVSGMLVSSVTFGLAAALVVIGLWVSPPVLAGFNVFSIALVVVITTSFVFPRFDRAETMRPWSSALDRFVSEEEMVFLYKPRRWMEYGLQFYRSGHAEKVSSPEELVRTTQSGSRVLCISEEKMLNELSHVAGIDIEVVHTVGNQAAFWVRPSK